jgi:hypothetical protein
MLGSPVQLPPHLGLLRRMSSLLPSSKANHDVPPCRWHPHCVPLVYHHASVSTGSPITVTTRARWLPSRIREGKRKRSKAAALVELLSEVAEVRKLKEQNWERCHCYGRIRDAISFGTLSGIRHVAKQELEKRPSDENSPLCRRAH